MPAILLWKMFLDYDRQKLPINKIIKTNLLTILILSIIVLLELYYIINFTGTHSLGYAGIETEKFPIIKFTRDSIYTIRHNIFFIVFLMGLLVYAISLWINNKNIKKLFINLLQEFSAIFIIFLLIVIPQMLLYYKSGMIERYLLPAMLGYAMIVSYIIHKIKHIFLWRVIIILFVIVIIFFEFLSVVSAAKQFTKEGKITNTLLNNVAVNTTPTSKILIVIDPINQYEYAYSIKTYLNLMLNLNQINFYMAKNDSIKNMFNDDRFNKSLFDSFNNSFNNIIVHDINKDFDIIIIFPNLLSRIQCNRNDYFEKHIDKFVILKHIRNGQFSSSQKSKSGNH
jgi:hypothetical protein